MTPAGEGGPGAGGGLMPSGFFAFRVPALPMSVLTSWCEGVRAPTAAAEHLAEALEHDRALLRRRLRRVAARAEVRSALSVASPGLLDALCQRPDEPGVEAALARYLSRMSSRATPYGMFAACGVGTIDRDTVVELPHHTTWRVHTQLDADYLDSLVRDRWRRFRDRLEFRPNQSLHLTGGRWRYVQSRLDGLERSHHLLQVTDTAHLQRALASARGGATFTDVVNAVAAGVVDPDRAARYVDNLIEAQVLVSTLAVTISGPPPLDALIADLELLGDEEAVAVLSDVREQLLRVDREGAGAAVSGHDRIAARLAGLPAPIERSRLFHAQLVAPARRASLASSTVDGIIRGVDLLRRMAPLHPASELDAFRDAFRERYGDQEVSLLEALDEEIGVGFGADPGGGDRAPLLDELRFPTEPGTRVTFGGRERRLLEILHRAWTAGEREVDLTSEDIDALARDDAPAWPAAVGATAVLARTRWGPRIVVTGAAGPSGARLLGRFCHADPELERQVRAHLRAEEALDPDAVHAEIVHLPSGRLVNVLARPVLRPYEIEWLGRSGASPERVLPAADLLLSLQDDRFVLRSATLGRRVLPRLTSAHNYSRDSPGVYRFLAAVQADGRAERVGWSWFPFDRVPSTPRLRRGPIVLALARWWVGRQELVKLDHRDPTARWRSVADWRERRGLPRWVCLVEDDNVLPFDLDNAVSVDAFVRTVRARAEVLLEELFPGPDELVASSPDGHHAMEVVVPLLASGTAPAAKTGRAPAPAVRRTFPPGTEWTYLKLYTGSATADRLLTEAIGPCVRGLVGSGAADRWFFLRYGDPGFHLRVRVHGDAGAARSALESVAAAAVDEGLAHDAAFGTYQREIERYGGDQGILVAERLFQADSETVVDLLDLFDAGEAGLDSRWRIGLLGADLLLRDLGLDETTRAALCRRMGSAYAREMNADARLRKDVARKLRAERAALEDLLRATGNATHPLAPGLRVLSERSERVAPLAGEFAGLGSGGRLTTSLESLAGSFVHMWLNRLSRSESRRQEYVTYSLLDRLYAARAARATAGP